MEIENLGLDSLSTNNSKNGEHMNHQQDQKQENTEVENLDYYETADSRPNQPTVFID